METPAFAAARPDLIDRAVAGWATYIGYAESEEDTRMYTEYFQARTCIGRALRPVGALAWAVTAGAMSVAVPVTMVILKAHYPNSPVWSFLDPAYKPGGKNDD